MGQARTLISLDTNVLLRIIVRDDPGQYDTAVSVLMSPVFVPTTVLLETAWVLANTYKLERTGLADALLGIIDAPTVTVDDEVAVRWALGRYREARSDIADLLHLVQARRSDKFVTFDNKLAAQAGSKAPVAIAALTA
jgi:predicted nucleic-acid-binding protein